MRESYKIILTPEENGSYTVFVPDFDSGARGKSCRRYAYGKGFCGVPPETESR